MFILMSVVEAAVEDRLQVVLEFLIVAAVSTILRWTLTVVEARRADERAFEWTKACEKLLVESNTYCKAQRPNLVIII